ncbi:MAG: hypothetical protein IT163_08285 [Bryobacterales bacterium]|nr:hypothetical protein [Bryobacterales bacterium]
MKRYGFPLARVLAFRRLQRDMERAALERALAEVRRIAELGEQVRRETEATAHDLVTRPPGEPVDGTQLAGLDGYRRYLKRVAAEVDLHHRRAEVAAGNQRLKLVEAERRMKVLEHLEARTRKEWDAALNKEIEEFAGEAFLARRARGPRGG